MCAGKGGTVVQRLAVLASTARRFPGHVSVEFAWSPCVLMGFLLNTCRLGLECVLRMRCECGWLFISVWALRFTGDLPRVNPASPPKSALIGPSFPIAFKIQAIKITDINPTYVRYYLTRMFVVQSPQTMNKLVALFNPALLKMFTHSCSFVLRDPLSQKLGFILLEVHIFLFDSSLISLPHCIFQYIIIQMPGLKYLTLVQVIVQSSWKFQKERGSFCMS